MNTNHIIFFTQLYYPDVTTIAIIMTDLVEDLAAYGMNTKVVCAQPTYIKNAPIGGFRDSGIQEFRNKNKFRNLGIKSNSGI
jgi:hypothetical protein